MTLKKLKDEILAALEISPMTTREIRARVSGTRGDIVDAILDLKRLKLIDQIGHELPRTWTLPEPTKK